MSDNSAVVKIIAQHAREYNELSTKYTDSVSRERDVSNAYADLKILYDHVRKENKRLKILLEGKKL